MVNAEEPWSVESSSNRGVNAQTPSVPGRPREASDVAADHGDFEILISIRCCHQRLYNPIHASLMRPNNHYRTFHPTR